MAKRMFTQKFMKALAVPTKQQGDRTYFDTRDQGKALVLRVSYGGAKTWKLAYYVKVKNASGKIVTVLRAKKIGRYPELSEDAAYEKLASFSPATQDASYRAGSFGDIALRWLAEYVRKKGLRSAPEIERHLKTYVLQAWGDTPIYDIRRSHVNELLDEIRDKKIINSKRQHVGGTSQADAVLATIRGVMTWWETRDDDYESPIRARMKLKRDQRSLEEKARRRVLSDDEIRALWAAAEKLGNRGALVHLLLLTGQRLRTVAGMRWHDIVENEWTIPRDVRAKGNAGKVRLPRLAMEVLKKLSRVAGTRDVFPASRGERSFEGFSQLKSDLDRLLPADFMPWVLHDLRRTARTRMAEIGVPDKIAELTLGHKIVGIEAVYNRNDYFAPKSAALERLAIHIAEILSGATNVIPLRSGDRLS